MEAITREEKIMSGENLTPITRKEMFLAKLVGQEIETPSPITRVEKIMNGDQLTPITREEMFLAKSTGQDVKTPTPITRREMFLSKIGGGSGGEETKYYTVNFYNGDELLQSVSVPQGGNAVYTGNEPVKEGEWAFNGWNPTPTNITEDTDCYAQFKSTAIVTHKLLDRTIERYESATLKTVRRFAFVYATELTCVDLTTVTDIGDYAFQGCSKLTALIIRTGSVCTAAPRTWTGTPIISGTGYIYVPRELVDDYKAYSRWSDYASRIRAIEDYPDICGGA